MGDDETQKWLAASALYEMATGLTEIAAGRDGAEHLARAKALAEAYEGMRNATTTVNVDGAVFAGADVAQLVEGALVHAGKRGVAR